MEPFADADPEDGWDASDLVVIQFDNVVIRLRLLLQGVTGDRAARAGRVFDDLATIRHRLGERDG